MMNAELNKVQLEILRLLKSEDSEEDLKEIKSLIIAYLSYKVTREADKAYLERGYSQDVFEQWKQEHFRKSA